MKRLGILLSGRGSNFEAIADQVASGSLKAAIAVVISNRPEARGLAVARERGLNAVSIPSKGLDREVYDRLVIEELNRSAVDLVCLAGFMRLLSASFVRAFPQRVLNIHPSLLPAFPGLDAQLVEALDNALGNGIVAASGAERGFAALVTQHLEADAVGLLRRRRGNRRRAHKPSCRTMSSVTVRASSGSPP